jgi:hypothetical protein
MYGLADLNTRFGLPVARGELGKGAQIIQHVSYVVQERKGKCFVFVGVEI